MSAAALHQWNHNKANAHRPFLTQIGWRSREKSWSTVFVSILNRTHCDYADQEEPVYSQNQRVHITTFTRCSPAFYIQNCATSHISHNDRNNFMYWKPSDILRRHHTPSNICSKKQDMIDRTSADKRDTNQIRHLCPSSVLATLYLGNVWSDKSMGHAGLSVLAGVKVWALVPCPQSALDHAAVLICSCTQQLGHGTLLSSLYSYSNS